MFSRIVLALALLAGVQAFAPVSRAIPRGRVLNGLEQAAGLQGPAIFWGSDGVLQGKDENDIRGYETFTAFPAAVQAAGINLSQGEFTVLLPIDSACAGKVLSREVCEYHIIPGKVPKGSIAGPTTSLSGKQHTYKYFARQLFLDDAVIGQVPQGAATGQTFPTDVDAGNVLIHTIDQVLDPAYTPVDLNAGKTSM